MSEVFPERTGFLSGSDFRTLLAKNDQICVPAPKPENIKDASVDLTVGDVFAPCGVLGKLGGPDRPRTCIDLKQGETAVIRTREKLCLPGDVGAIGFPPATLSQQGMLTTNPGHVDPGYQGFLHLTVINMSKQVLHLERGMRIMRVLLFWSAGSGVCHHYPNPITEQLLERLSPDFLDFGSRAADAAEKAVLARQLWLPIITGLAAAVITAAGSSIGSYYANRERIDGLEKRIERLDGEMNPRATTASLQALDVRLKKIEDRLPETKKQ